MNKTIRNTLLLSKYQSLDDKKRACDNIFIEEEKLKFFECKTCSNEFKIKFIICEECKECHNHTSKMTDLRKKEGLRRSSLKATNSDFIKNQLKRNTQISSITELSNSGRGVRNLSSNNNISKYGEITINRREKSNTNSKDSNSPYLNFQETGNNKNNSSKPTSKSKKNATSKFTNTIIDVNIVRVDEEQALSQYKECMCSINKHRSLVSGKTNNKLDKSLIDTFLKPGTLYGGKSLITEKDLINSKSNKLNENNKASSSSACLFKGRYYKSDDSTAMICDICLKNCTKKTKNELESSIGNLDFDTTINCACSKQFNHDNNTFLLDFLGIYNNTDNLNIKTNDIIDRAFYSENIVHISSKILVLLENQNIISFKRKYSEENTEFFDIYNDIEFETNFPFITEINKMDRAYTIDNKNENDGNEPLIKINIESSSPNSSGITDDLSFNNYTTFNITLTKLMDLYSNGINNSISSIKKLVKMLINLLMHFNEYILFQKKINTIQKMIHLFSLSLFNKEEFEAICHELSSKVEETGTAFFIDIKTYYSDQSSLGKRLYNFLEINLLSLQINYLDLKVNYSFKSNTFHYLNCLTKTIVKVIYPMFELIIKDQLKSEHFNAFLIGLYSILTIQKYINFFLKRLSWKIELNKEEFGKMIRLIIDILNEITFILSKKIEILFSSELFYKTKLCPLFSKIILKNMNLVLLLKTLKKSNKEIISKEEMSLLFYSNLQLLVILYQKKNITISSLNTEIMNYLYRSVLVNSTNDIYSSTIKFMDDNQSDISNILMSYDNKLKTSIFSSNDDLFGRKETFETDFLNLEDSEFFNSTKNINTYNSINLNIYSPQLSNLFILDQETLMKIDIDNYQTTLISLLNLIDKQFSEIYKGDLLDLGEKLDADNENIIEFIEYDLLNKLNKKEFFNNVQESNTVLNRNKISISSSNSYFKASIFNEKNKFQKIVSLFNYLFCYINYYTNNGKTLIERSLESSEINLISSLLLKLIPGIIYIPYIFQYFIRKKTLKMIIQLDQLGCQNNLFVLFRVLLNLLTNNNFYIQEDTLKIIIDRVFNTISESLLSMVEQHIFNMNNPEYINSFEFYDFFYLIHTMFKIQIKFKSGVELFYNFYKNILTIMYFPYIKNSIDAFLLKLNKLEDKRKYSIKNNDLDDKDLNIFLTEEYKIYKMMIEINAYLSNNLKLESKHDFFHSKWFYNIMKIDIFDLNAFLHIKNKREFLFEKFEFISIFVDYLVGLFPFNMVQDPILLDFSLQSKLFVDQEDILIENFYSYYKNQRFYSQKYFYIRLISYLFDIVFNVLFSEDYKYLILLTNAYSDNNEDNKKGSAGVNLGNIFLLKIFSLAKTIFKFMKQSFQKNHYKETYLLEIRELDISSYNTKLSDFNDFVNRIFIYKLSTNRKNSQQEVDLELMNIPIIDLFSLLIIFLFKEKVLNNSSSKDKISILSLDEINTSIHFLEQDFLKVDQLMKLINMINICSNLTYINSYNLYAKSEINDYCKLKMHITDKNYIQKVIASSNNYFKVTNFEIIFNFLYVSNTTSLNRIVATENGFFKVIYESITEDCFEYFNNIERESIHFSYFSEQSPYKYYFNKERMFKSEIISFEAFYDNIMEIYENTEDYEELSENYRKLGYSIYMEFNHNNPKIIANNYHPLQNSNFYLSNNKIDDYEDRYNSNYAKFSKKLTKKQVVTATNKNILFNQNNDESYNLDYNELWYSAYFCDISLLLYYFTKISNFQEHFNDYFINKIRDFPKLLFFYLVRNSFSFYKQEFHQYKFSSDISRAASQRKKSFYELLKNLKLMKAIFQDNSQKYLIEQDHISLSLPDTMYGLILLMISSTTNFHFNYILGESNIISSHENTNVGINKNKLFDEGITILLDEFNLVLEKLVDLICEYVQGSFPVLEKIKPHFQISLRILLKSVAYNTFINEENLNMNVISTVTSYKYQGYLLLRFLLEEFSVIPKEIKKNMKEFLDVNLIMDDFVFSNYISAQILNDSFTINDKIETIADASTTNTTELDNAQLNNLISSIKNSNLFRRKSQLSGSPKRQLEEHNLLNNKTLQNLLKETTLNNNTLMNKDNNTSTNYDKTNSKISQSNLFDVLITKSFEINEETSFNTSKLLFIVMKYLKTIYFFKEFDSLLNFKDKSNFLTNRNHSFQLQRKKNANTKDANFYSNKSKVINLDYSNTVSRKNTTEQKTNSLYNISISMKNKKANSHNSTSDISNNNAIKKENNKINDEIYNKPDFLILNNIQAIGKLVDFYDKIILSIEVYYNNDYMFNLSSMTSSSPLNEKKLKKIYFDIPVDYYLLSNSTKFFFLNECKRDNQLSKLDELVDNIDLFMREINFHKNKSKSIIQSLFQLTNIKHCEIILFFITLSINLIILAILRQNNSNEISEIKIQQDSYMADQLGNLFMKSIRYVSHLFLSSPINIEKTEYNSFYNNTSSSSFINNYSFTFSNELNFYLLNTLSLLKILQLSFCLFILIFWTHDRYFVYFKSLINRQYSIIDKNAQNSLSATKNEKLSKFQLIKIALWDAFLLKNEVNGFLFVFFLGILSIVFEFSWYFNGLQLASFINLNKYLKNILLVIQKRYLQLLLTLILLVIVVYLFTLIAFYFFHQEFYSSELNENLCETLMICFITEINYALRNDGGIMPKRNFSQDNVIAIYRFFYDLMFFFPINILLLNAILGIIVDTFKELREKKDQEDYDKENICFICGLSRHEIKSNGINYDDHCELDHNIWNYSYFLLNLNRLQGQDMNTYELYVDTLIKSDNYSFFPNKTYWKPNSNM